MAVGRPDFQQGGFRELASRTGEFNTEFSGTINIAGGGNTTVVLYTVPAGKVALISDIVLACDGQPGRSFWFINGVTENWPLGSPAQDSRSHSFATAWRGVAGNELRVQVFNLGGADDDYFFSALVTEIDA